MGHKETLKKLDKIINDMKAFDETMAQMMQKAS